MKVHNGFLGNFYFNFQIYRLLYFEKLNREISGRNCGLFQFIVEISKSDLPYEVVKTFP